MVMRVPIRPGHFGDHKVHTGNPSRPSFVILVPFVIVVSAWRGRRQGRGQRYSRSDSAAVARPSVCVDASASSNNGAG